MMHPVFEARSLSEVYLRRIYYLRSACRLYMACERCDELREAVKLASSIKSKSCENMQ